MNYKKIASVLMTISFIMIISGGVSSFVIGLKEDRQSTYKRINYVTDEFEVFSSNISSYESYRDDLYNDVLGNVYFETMYANDSVVKNKLSNYENVVDEIKKNSNSLSKLCDDVYYPDSSANSKCKNYRTIYEQVVNYFVTDINLYNSNVDKYNEYQASIGSNFIIEKYKTKKKYIDYNDDGKFDGKEEE